MLIFIIILAVSVPALPQFPEGVELTSLDIEDIPNGMEISGSIVNNGPHTIENSQINVTFRKSGKIVSYLPILIKPSTLRPSVTGRFEWRYVQLEYDEYDYRIQGAYETMPDYFTKIDMEDLTGTIDIVEGSQNVTPYYAGGYVSFLGEIVNNTPAFFRNVTVKINVYNDNDVLLLEHYGVKVSRLHPGEKATYHMYTDEISLEDLGKYKVMVEPSTPIYLLPTAVEGKSWGTLKAAMGGRE